MEKTDILVVGAGVVGLAIGRLLSEKYEVVVIEQHDSFGRETSSRNSEVIHAGFYYPADSLKAKLCVRSNPLLYEYCRRSGIPNKQIGKIVIGNSDTEIKKIQELFEQGKNNGVPGLAVLSEKEVSALEPAVRGKAGLLSESTGIIDSHSLMKSFVRDAAQNGATVAYGCKITTIQKETSGYVVGIRDTDNQVFTIAAPMVVNAAGLWADTVSAMVGIDVAGEEYVIHPCKGEYFSVASCHKGKVSRLVYPAPTSISLGVHAVIGLSGSLKLGPNAFYVHSKEDYSVDPEHRSDFVQSAHEYLPFIRSDDLSPDMSGIRPKLQQEGEGFRDFVIRNEADKGLNGFINLVGIESPGLTASVAIAEYVKGIVEAL